MALTLPNLYVSPADIYELVGVDAAQLRLDDRNLATGQQVALAVAAAIGDVSLTTNALQYGLLRGTRLVFGDAAMTAPVEATLTSAAPAGSTTLAVAALTTVVNAGSVATDNGVNVWLAGMLLKACRYATSQVKAYCCGRYEDSDLAANASETGSVNRWATALAARWLAKRAYREAPAGIEADYKEAMDELKAVQCDRLSIEDIGTRTSGWPYMSNVTIDLGYTYRKVRVEPTISEPTPTQYPQAVDWNSIMSFEF